MIAPFFIKRPILASVLSIILVFAGIMAMVTLPIEQYPNMTPPQIQVTATYPGASAQTIADTVAAPLEQQINGTENMIYMYSQNSSAGSMTLSVYFEIGTDPDIAQTNVQNNVNLAMSQLPTTVQKQGVNVQKQMPNILLIVALKSTDGRYDDIFMSNFANINVVQELQLLPGLSNVTIIGFKEYAMRLWLRPDRMAQMGITVQDVIDAVKGQNQQFATGRLGQEPMNPDVPLTISVVAQGRLIDPQEFNQIILRANPDGSVVLLRDVGYAELGAQNYDVDGELNNQGTTLVATYLQYGANALDVAEDIKKTMANLAKDFPAGIEYSVPYDTTLFVKISIKEVVITLCEAAVLVCLVVLLFLQNIRATIIPVAAMVVSIIGTLAGMYVFGFSINTLTLFGMVLAIGIVVDDAIVVVENVERNMRALKLPPKEAAFKAMEEVTGPVIAIVCVLVAVFVPVAFMGGIAGQLYRQFALTISISVVISGGVALTLSPMLSALLLKPHTKENAFSRGFNHYFGLLADKYIVGARFMATRRIIGCCFFVLLMVLLGWLVVTVPPAFVPNEDQGYLIGMVNLPDTATLQRTEDVATQIWNITKEEPTLNHLVSLTGYSLMESLNRTNIATEFIVLKDWSERTKPDQSADAVRADLMKKYGAITDAKIMVFNPPAIQGLGTVGGFEFWIESRGDATIDDLGAVVQKFVDTAKNYPALSPVISNLQPNSMQLYIDVDKSKAISLGVSIEDLYQAVQLFIGSLYVNDFDKYGRVYQVMLQADPNYRSNPNDISEIYVRSNNGHMIPLKSFVSTKFYKGPNLLSRFNGFPGVRLNAGPAPGYTSGQAMKAMNEIAEEVLPQGMYPAWSGVAYQEQTTGGASTSALFAGLLMIFLILSALYERWSLPAAVMLATPFGVLGAFLIVWLRGMSDDVYFQIGLLTLVALSAKNAILIVEFAIIKRQEGKSPLDAALEAAHLRFRAILMTSLTFILGVVPLVTSKGAGAASRHSVGTGVLGGMIVATICGLLFVPLFFRIIEERATRNRLLEEKEKQEAHVEDKETKGGHNDPS